VEGVWRDGGGMVEDGGGWLNVAHTRQNDDIDDEIE